MIQNLSGKYKKITVFLLTSLFRVLQNLNSNLSLLKLMMSAQRMEYNEVIYNQIANSFTKLTQLMEELSNPTLVNHCKMWKLQKGAKKLIQLAIEGDKILTKQSKNIKKSANTQHKQLNTKTIFKRSNSKTNSHEIKQQLDQNQRVDQIKRNLNVINQNLSVQFEQNNSNFLNQNEQNDARLKKQELFQMQSQQNDHKQQSFSKFMLNDEELQPRVKKQEQIKISRQYLRGPYKNYSKQLKQKVVELYTLNLMPLGKISHQYEVPIKNIKRWAQNGVNRKQGAGRKRLDPNMQDELQKKIKMMFQQGSIIQIDQIRMLALNLSKITDFKASKGWIMNFVERYKLNQKYHID